MIGKAHFQTVIGSNLGHTTPPHSTFHHDLSHHNLTSRFLGYTSASQSRNPSSIMASKGRTTNPEANRTTLKTLVKIEGNKSCADCKRNKHPRWASWNIGVFVCIRCSGIHRSMGVHISRVKSVDLDTWTDEQTQSMVKWGNARANKYWEAKLAPGHVPSETKIENFIRTKYDSKRWVMDGGMPDPSTLDDGVDADDDVVRRERSRAANPSQRTNRATQPLNIVQEKAKLAQPAVQATAAPVARAPLRQTQIVDLFGDEPPAPRPSSGPPAQAAARPPPAQPAPAPAPAPRQIKPADSLLGLDFFGEAPAAPPPRSASAAPAAGGISRPDLKQSILSLYASSSTAASQPKPQAQMPSAGFGFGSPASSQTASSSMNGLQDSFGGLNFGTSTISPAAPTVDPFASLGQSSRAPQKSVAQPAFGGTGSFFDAPAPTPRAAAAQPASKTTSSFGNTSNSLGDLGDLLSGDGFGAPQKSPPMSKPSGFGSLASPTSAAPSTSSAFNLSNRAPAPKPVASTGIPSTALSGADVWGSSDVWGAPSPAAPAQSTTISTSNNGFGAPSAGFSTGGFGAPTPISGPPDIAADDDFGGWSSAPSGNVQAAQTSTNNSAKPATNLGAASDDLFSNVWG